MNAQEFQPIETELGNIYGRDAIYLDSLDTVSLYPFNLKLVGSINGALCSKSSIEGFFPYELRFNRILALKIVELDSWDHSSSSSFDEVVNSKWLQSLGGKVDSSYKHFVIQTYDYVFDVVCKKYNLEIMSGKASE